MSARSMIVQPRAAGDSSLRRRSPQHSAPPFPVPSPHRCQSNRENKQRQAEKIRAIGEVLTTEGYRSLSDQTKVLGLSRSTTWTIIKANHKSSGLSAATINSMLATPRLPRRVRLVLLEYIEEKTAGLYGDGNTKIRRFIDRVSIEHMGPRPTGLPTTRDATEKIPVHESPALAAPAPRLTIVRIYETA
jgi:predicted DNA-binding transcriptional regulator AlpA